MLKRLQKTCEKCKQDRRNSRKYCSYDFKKKQGLPVGTMRSAGYAVSTSGGDLIKLELSI